MSNNLSYATYIEPDNSELLLDVVEGLSRDQKTLPCKYLYDERGAQLFNAICDTKEYYVTRTELAIMREHVAEMADVIGPQANILEFGSGAGTKIRLLLNALISPDSYTPMDISEEMLFSSSAELQKLFPALNIHPVCGDYTKPFPALEGFHAQGSSKQGSGKKVVYFPGSTLSNFDTIEAVEFLSRIAELVGTAGGLLIGIDLIKQREIFKAAYNDDQGVTAEFNKNLLRRINRELDADFDLDGFAHHAPYNEEFDRVEMHLVSQTDQKVSIDGHVFHFAEGETLHTENSYKYSLSQFSNLAAQCGFTPVRAWVDSDELFSVHYLEVC